jgi:hypothetical protein
MLQLETLVRGDWTPVARYDTAHGFAHLDVLHLQGTQDKVHMQEVNLSKALELAFADFLENAELYVRQYTRKL